MILALSRLQQLNGSNMKRSIFILFLGLISSGIYGQKNFQSEYLEAKRLFSSGDYKNAKNAFLELSQPESGNNFYQYASFFSGLSSVKLGEFEDAKNMFLQILQKYPKWDKKGEVNYWLAHAYLELGDHERGFEKVSKAKGDLLDLSIQLKKEYLSKQDDAAISGLYYSYSGDKLIAQEYANRLKEGDLSENQELLLEIIKENDLDIRDYVSVNYDNIKKDTYNIAVLLPFRFDSIENLDGVMRNRLVMDLYEGLKFGAEELQKQGKVVNIYPYDTKGKSIYTQRILQKEELKSMDLIYGPLFPGAFREVYDFSAKYKINMFNPISSNPSVVGNNPFSFLNNPSTPTKAQQLAAFANETFENKRAWVMYEKRDSVYAAIYRDELLDYGFEVSRFGELNKETIRPIIDTLTGVYEIELAADEVDSVKAAYPEIEIKTKRYRNSYERYSYFEKYWVEPDSLGHIFVASNSNLYATNFVSANITRPDTIGLVGQDAWLNIEVISYDQMENIGLYLCHPQYTDINSDNYKSFQSSFLNKFKVLPSKNHLIGYESVMFLGNMMHEHGKYFQEGLRGGEFVEGNIMSGYKYGLGNDNQVVPVVKVIESELIKSN